MTVFEGLTVVEGRNGTKWKLVHFRPGLVGGRRDGFLFPVMMPGIVLIMCAFASPEASDLYRVAAAAAQLVIYFCEVLGQVIWLRLAQHWKRSQPCALRQILCMGVLSSLSLVTLGFVLVTLRG